MTYVKVTVENEKYLQNLAEAVNVSEDVYASQLAQAAYYHVNYIMEQTPPQIAGKIAVDVSDLSGMEIEITYRTKAGAEASTVTLPKSGGSIFISSEKLGASTRPTSFTRTGEQGIFVSKIAVGGRPAIDAWVMAQIALKLPSAAEATLEEARTNLYAAIQDWFIAHGINWNESLGRYQASSEGVLFNGVTFSPGQIIAGAL